jgi:threonine aldolase
LYSFKNDYSEGCHPQILQLLSKYSLIQQKGYGEDDLSNKAKALIKQKIQSPNASIHFVSGGTQANIIVLAASLRPHESVVAARSGHICVHEAGAIEATGHKIEMVDTETGKLTPNHIQGIIDKFEDHHMTKPKMVYISNATELGTIYTKEELKNLYVFCKENKLYLYLDGARIGSALASRQNDISWEDLAQYTDVCYLGGTKNGALLGEAIVILHEDLKKDFLFHIKQRGALLAKGSLLGIQFYGLFSEDLFMSLARHANEMAYLMADSIQKKGYLMLTPVASNQIFPILPNDLIQKLLLDFDFYIWKKINAEQSAIRLVTSWATEEKFVRDFCNIIEGYDLM